MNQLLNIKKVALPTLLVFLWLSAAWGEIIIVDSSLQEKLAEQGETYEGVFFVRNTSEKPAEVKIYQTTYQAFFELDDKEGEGPEDTQGSNAEWITFRPRGVVIRPRATIGINYTVNIPDDPSLRGIYRSVIVVEQISQGVRNLEEDGRLGVKVVTYLGNITVLKSKILGGMVKGRVFDIETNKGIPHVVLKINEAVAVTDKRGNFIFDSLQPGKYFFSVQKLSIPRDKVPVEKNPRELCVRNGEVTWVSVGLTQVATLTGKIILYPFENDENIMAHSVTENGASEEAKLNEGIGLERALIELSNGSETRRRLADASGGFTFKDLPQGKWTISVNEKYLPPDHRLENEAIEIDVRAGEANDALVRVVPGEPSMSRKTIAMLAKADVEENAPISRTSLALTTTNVEKKAASKQIEKEVSQAKPEARVVSTFLPRAQKKAGQLYTVRSGDWLSKIAERVYGDPMKYTEIFAANRDIINDPDNIYPGQELQIPEVGEKQYYTVRAGDWLSRIAQRFYGNAMKYSEIFAANRDIIDDPDMIFPGQMLTIPQTGQNYTVQVNDWLSKIASRFYGDPGKYTEILAENRGVIQNPDLIYSGQKLRIPTVGQETGTSDRSP